MHKNKKESFLITKYVVAFFRVYVELLRNREIKSENGLHKDVMVKRKKQKFDSFQLTYFCIKETRPKMHFAIS